MTKLTNIIAGTLIPLALTISGCSVTVGGTKPMDLSKSSYVKYLEKSAQNSIEKYSRTYDIFDLKDAVNAYGSIGKLDEMDKLIKEIITQDAEMGLFYAKIGEEYHKLFKKSKKNK